MIAGAHTREHGDEAAIGRGEPCGTKRAEVGEEAAVAPVAFTESRRIGVPDQGGSGGLIGVERELGHKAEALLLRDPAGVAQVAAGGGGGGGGGILAGWARGGDTH